ncbi:uncharacterized protein LOC128959740 [Oppia nitens]|uniref:uncharacterized protein LOC128959740 n=1 Tax=Oppia nitens TaxID=1686743 RepID=UPI0023DCB5DC|nr:uncharacterized protein LOC128959740 [Oppia nitens]
MDKNNNKSSFDRFGDDLADLILRYLSLEDQLRLECVSKQFQSLGIQRRTHIIFGFNLNQKLRVKPFSTSGYFDTENWSSLMKRSPNVRTIGINTSTSGYRDIQLIEAIHRFRRHWPLLRQIDCTIDNYTDKDIEFVCKRFTKMINKMIIYLFDQIDIIKPYLSSMTALRELSSIRNIDDTFIGDQLVVKGLHRLSCDRLDNTWTRDHLKRLETFIDGNSYLKRLKLHFTSMDYNTCVSVLSLIGRFEELEQLGIRFDLFYHFSIAEPLLTIANSCRRLKSLKLELKADSLVSYKNIFNAIKHMKQLKRLDLNGFYVINQLNDHMVDPSLSESLELINCWPHLTHLSLRLSLYNRHLFWDIHRNLPKLQCLYIDDSFDIIDGLCLSFISRLKSLMTLTIDTKNYKSINKSDVNQVMNSCLKLKSISINSIPNDKSIHSQ